MAEQKSQTMALPEEKSSYDTGPDGSIQWTEEVTRNLGREMSSLTRTGTMEIFSNLKMYEVS
jgi:hypothetical protein